MGKNEIYLGNTLLHQHEEEVSGGFEIISGEKYYKISNYNLMPDFFMTIVSNSNHWMFLSSNGSLSAGRKDRDNALFPYYSDDKIHDYAGQTGSKTIALVEESDKTYLWEPFSNESDKVYKIERNIYKGVYGNKVIFEEINTDLGVCFRYGWSFSEKFGFVKTSSIQSISDGTIKVDIVDGLRNLLPAGMDYQFQNEFSNLSDAYKKAELIDETKVGLFMLSSIPVDRAEPSESLNATTVWSEGLSKNKILISDNQLEKFRKGVPIKSETDIRASKGAFYVNAELVLKDQQPFEWMIVAEINQSTTEVANLNSLLKSNAGLIDTVKSDIGKNTAELIKIVASADGLQYTNDELCAARHFSNTLFNVMRGGTYNNNYLVDGKDFQSFAVKTNKVVCEKYRDLLQNLAEKISNTDLIQQMEKTGNNDLVRIAYEYLPLTFSRRHGDPSRPWNHFTIDNKNEDGSQKLDFQGNWRDIFQNWEALSLSYPEFIENIISKFVNASTADGYNPYRIMRDGIDWECPDPDDPWAYIGYWGDHQIIYLEKLLELSANYHPGKLDSLLTQEIFAFANVPYRIKAYQEIIKNPQDTIEFDFRLNELITEKVKELGADGRLIIDTGNQVYKVNLTEKILITLLARLSNFIPEAGIWMNTQRPEWNDANNALVGNGVSMVTLYYLRRFLKFWDDKLGTLQSTTIEISEEVEELFENIYALFSENTGVLKHGFSDTERRFFVDKLGEAGTVYRNKVYQNYFSGRKERISTSDLIGFIQTSLKYIDQSIRVNKRKDGLYHAYNLISFSKKGIKIRHLYEMLEGQVAVLSSGFLKPEESLEVLDALKTSALFREDQFSYLLYPDRELPRFIEKNNIPIENIEGSALLSKLIKEKDVSIVESDQSGNYHFKSSFRNAGLLSNALNNLDSKKYGVPLRREYTKVLDLYEEMFDHKSFTGRSGTFYGYEGLGSIYWHMVSKLLLATEECFFKAIDKQCDPSTIGRLKDHYYEIKAGIGLYKSPKLYGAFPTDPYSHSPGNAGVKQPGMTGQVKEDFLSRMGELGVRIEEGRISFDTSLINSDEFFTGPTTIEYYKVSGKKHELELVENQLFFTICQVPVVYSYSVEEKISVCYKDGNTAEISGNSLSKQISEKIFKKTGEIELVHFPVKKSNNQ